MNNILAISYELYYALSLTCVIGAFLCAIMVIVAVLIQPSNSNGVSAITGQAETFYNKSKGKTLASTMKKITYVCMCLIAVFMIAFYILIML